MARQCELDRIFGIRVRLKWDTRKKEIWLESDESDMAKVPMENLLRYSGAVDTWARDFLARNPGWKIDGITSQVENGEESDVDQKFTVPVRERTEAEDVSQGAD